MDPTFGGKHYNESVEEAAGYYRDAVRFYLRILMQDGYLPGTVPPKNAAEALQLAWPTGVVLFQRAQTDPASLTPREQKALREFLQLLGDANASRN